MKILYILIFTLLSSCSSTSINKSNEQLHANILEQPINTIIEDKEPSFDGNEQNSGIIDFKDEIGWIVTEKAINRYKLLLQKYGNDIQKSIPDLGITSYNDNFALTQEAMINFALLNQKHKLNPDNK